MSYYDPHTGVQIRALRSDPTGRYNRMSTDCTDDPWRTGLNIGISAGCVLLFVAWAVFCIFVDHY